ncbi:aminopeptidase N [mine drainage metagenome]|uniref:Aminopeptidase N n=2 Tax=mine drainage metagenome TaxID=410659 RepID=T1C669_9ZZZZ
MPWIRLEFDLDPEQTRVSSQLRIERAPESSREDPLVLHGEGLTLVSLSLNGQVLDARDFQLTGTGLVIPHVPDQFVLETVVVIGPAHNTMLSGLYLTGGVYCTQCEAQGFRRITYFIDRPDILSCFEVRIHADQELQPTLLSNGNRTGGGLLPKGRHYAIYEDPFPKPCYLFALVAGTFRQHEGTFRTQSGRTVALAVHVEPHNWPRGQFALEALQRAMRFDEDYFGRQYDLSQYHIVAVDDCNMGAMENKSLNIFNSKYILADPETATDQDYENILSVVGHEYFHNWTGNRITIRDWFQLALKEGLTVYRERCFMAHQGAQVVRRIRDVRTLRAHQFTEDAGPLAHPVRPQAYHSIDNFYTATVYEKGAEVIRMCATILGETDFKKGLELYFERYDGRTVTLEDFLEIMEQVYGQSLHPFERWLDRSGTPRIECRSRYDRRNRRLRITLTQLCPAPRSDSEPDGALWIPVKLGLLSDAGKPLTFRVEGRKEYETETVLNQTQHRQTFVLDGVQDPPLISGLRDFSAPVIWKAVQSDRSLRILILSDPDGLNRWEASQEMAVRLIRARCEASRNAQTLPSQRAAIRTWRGVLAGASSDPALTVELLTLPDELWLCESIRPFDPATVRSERDGLRREIGSGLKDLWDGLYQEFASHQKRYRYSVEQAARRRLKLLALSYLVWADPDRYVEQAQRAYRDADNLTDRIGALAALNDLDHPARKKTMDDFRARYDPFPLVLDKWLTMQAISHRPQAIRDVETLTRDAHFNRRNPNRIYALIGAFVQLNPAGFHDPTGAGYELLASEIRKVDATNPQVAARLAKAFGSPWRWEDAVVQKRMEKTIRDLANEPHHSREVQEILANTLTERAPI